MRPPAGNHQDLFDSETSFGELCALLEEAQLSPEGLFLNTDSSVAAKALRADCFRRGFEANSALNSRSRQEEAADTYLDTELYRARTAIERTNAWLHSFKNLLVRIEPNADNWLAFLFLAFALLLLRNLPPFYNP